MANWPRIGNGSVCAASTKMPLHANAIIAPKSHPESVFDIQSRRMEVVFGMFISIFLADAEIRGKVGH